MPKSIEEQVEDWRYTVGILSAHEIRKTDAWSLYAQYIGFFIWPWRSYSVVADYR